MFTAVQEMELAENVEQMMGLVRQELTENKTVNQSFLIWANVADVPKEWWKLLKNAETNQNLAEEQPDPKVKDTTLIVVQNLFNDDKMMLAVLPIILSPTNVDLGISTIKEILSVAPGGTREEKVTATLDMLAKIGFGQVEREVGRKKLAAVFVTNLCKISKAHAYGHVCEAWTIRPRGRTKKELEAHTKYLESRGDMKWPSKHPDRESMLMYYLETRSGIRAICNTVFDIKDDKVVFENEEDSAHKVNVNALDLSTDQGKVQLIIGRFCNLLQQIKEPTMDEYKEAVDRIEKEKEKRQSVV